MPLKIIAHIFEETFAKWPKNKIVRILTEKKAQSSHQLPRLMDPIIEIEWQIPSPHRTKEKPTQSASSGSAITITREVICTTQFNANERTQQ